MGELPSEAFAARSSIALTGPVAGDSVADAVDAAEFFDVEVDHLAGIGAFVAPDWFYGVEIPHSAKAGATQSPAYGCGDTPTRFAMCLPHRRSRGSAMISSTRS